MARWLGAKVALLIAVAVLTIEDAVLGSFISAGGLVIGPVVGWWFGPRAMGQSSAGWLAVGIGLITTLAGSVLMSGLLWLDGGRIEDLLFVPLVWLYGIVLFGVPMLVVTIGAAGLWIGLLRVTGRSIAPRQGAASDAKAASTEAKSGWAGSISTSQEASRTGPSSVENV